MRSMYLPSRHRSPSTPFDHFVRTLALIALIGFCATIFWLWLLGFPS